MLTLCVILVSVSVACGIGLSIWLFGTGGKRSKVFQDIYFTIEDVDGVGVVYTKTGEYSAIVRMDNPVTKYSADIDMYYAFTSLMELVLQTLGEGYAVHKQDIFIKKAFHIPAEERGKKLSFLTASYYRFMDGRQYIAQETYLTITQENKKNGLFSYDASKWRDFLVKIHKVVDQLQDGGITTAELLDVTAAKDYVDRFFAMNFRDRIVSMDNYKVDGDGIAIGDRQMKVFSLLDVDKIQMPGVLRPYVELTVNNTVMPVDLLTDLDKIPDIDTVVYNQVLFLPNQRRELSALERKKNRHASIPNPGNLLAAEDIRRVMDVIARDSKQLVYAHYNLMVTIGKDKDMQKVTNHLENLFSRQGIHISKQSFNQLELFVASFPGNCYRFSPEYDRFLTLSDAALCMMYKERQAKGDITPVKCWFTDRQGVPMAIDTTGKEGKVKYTDNSNFFVLGPSGSGKSFFMNTVLRQYYEQNTDVVIVDTGDSYEELCGICNGTYITYSKEHPVSMNPFNVSIEEYTQNFDEKKNFLKSLILLLFRGGHEPSSDDEKLKAKLEDYIINKTIVEYYNEYFTPFQGYSESDREELRRTLLLQAKKDGSYERFEMEMEEKLGRENSISDEDRNRYEKLKIREEKLQHVLDDRASTFGEKAAARKRQEEARAELMRMTDIVETKYSHRIERRIARMEDQRRRLRVRELSFNSYYEYAVQRIPEITFDENISFNINEFASILKPFYRGGELEYTLNNNLDKSLFDERFIVFEIDKIKGDSVLFPIVVLIIMDVFTQKMRIKSNCRKCLVIEEAWKAIATPTMAEYIKYLYKTARKHWAMVGVVTQEIQDITSSPIVKDAIINNSDVFMLLDQAKFKDKFDDIRKTLSLNDIDCKKIFTINRLDNKEGRSPFKEVFIKRITKGEVYGIEEPRECYMSFTTEKMEKEALKLYNRVLRCGHQEAIERYVRDWNASGINKPLDFARKVMEAGKPLGLCPN
jgi:hypothetical protein